ncbi:hypothetical protein [Nonomuraea salmonea]|uniref:hypothetical protein n=1 Tax=Nonomuraea salmonea TaxID=46181 RepID=UPI002FEAAC0E
MRACTPPAAVVSPGSVPLLQVAPPSPDIAYAMPAAPPSDNRPVWCAATITSPHW